MEEVESVDLADGDGDGGRAQGFLQHPKPFAIVFGIDDEEPGTVQAEGTEARTVETAFVMHSAAVLAPDHQSRPNLGDASSTGRSEPRCPTACDFVQGAEPQPAARQMVVDGRRTGGCHSRYAATIGRALQSGEVLGQRLQLGPMCVRTRRCL